MRSDGALFFRTVGDSWKIKFASEFLTDVTELAAQTAYFELAVRKGPCLLQNMTTVLIKKPWKVSDWYLKALSNNTYTHI